MRQTITEFVKQHPGWAALASGAASLSASAFLVGGLAPALAVAGVMMIIAAIAYSVAYID